MERLLFIFALIPFLSFGQVATKSPCDRVIKTTYDKVENFTKKEFKRPLMIISKGKIISLHASKTQDSVVYISFIAGSPSGCIDKGNRIVILFTDGTKLETLNIYGLNCGQAATAQVAFAERLGNLEDLNLLKYKDIDVIRVYDTQYYTQVEVKDLQRKEIRELFNCLF